MSYGTHWGAYYGGVGAGGAVPQCYAVSERQVWVTVSRLVLAKSTIVQGDALNPASWSIARDDTGEDLMVMGVGVVNAYTFELYTLKKFGSVQFSHTVNASLRDVVTLSAVTVSDGFVGCEFVPEAEHPGGMVDFANPFFRGDSENPVSTLVMTSSGDYGKETGVDLYRKLIVRRLTTNPNEFFHLDPDAYGVGLRLKETPNAATMPALRADIINQLQREPEFSRVNVALQLTSQGVLIIVVRVTIAMTGENFDIPIPTSA